MQLGENLLAGLNGFGCEGQAPNLGPIDVFPAITPQMQKEALLFTLGFIILVSVAVGLALIY